VESEGAVRLTDTAQSIAHFTATASPPVYTTSMPSKCDHLKYGSSLLALLDERWTGFCPLCEMGKLYNDAQTPPKVKARLRRQIDAYTVPKLKPSSEGAKARPAVN
jgi:hypothetical protein